MEATQLCIDNTTTLIEFPSSSFQSPVETFAVKSFDTSEQVKLEIHSMTYSGQTNVMCHYGGFALYETRRFSQTETANHCFVEKEFQHRPIYPKNSSVFLVLFSCTEYGNFSSSLLLSVINCTCFSINPCMFQQSSLVPSEFGQFIDPRKLQKQISTLNLCCPSWKTLAKWFNFLGVIVKEEKPCIILQVYHGMDHVTQVPMRSWQDAVWGYFKRHCHLRNIYLLFEGSSKIQQYLKVFGFIYGM